MSRWADPLLYTSDSDQQTDPSPDYGYSCHYNRQIKKRGRVPRNGNTTDGPAQTTNDDLDYAPSPSHTLTFNGSAHGPSDEQDDANHVAHQPEASLYHSAPLREDQPGPTHAQHASFNDAVSDQGESNASPAQLHGFQEVRRRLSRPRASFSTIVRPHGFGPFSPRASEDSPADGPRSTSQQGTSLDCRYRCLEPLLPYLNDTLPASVACDLFDVFLVDPGTSLFHCASPYILTRIFRKKSLLHPTNPRSMSPALLATVLWCCAQTADLSLLLVPGSRSRVTNALYELATFLVTERDPDRWRRIHGELKQLFTVLQYPR